MTVVSLVVRPAEGADKYLLTAFRCAAGPTYENEVEDFVREDLLDWASDPHAASNDPRVLLLLDRDEQRSLVAVAAHERLTELLVDGDPLGGTKAQVVAVALECRGSRIAGRRIGDLAFTALVQDARARPERGPALAAVVAEGNAPSLALCDRYGLTASVPRSPGYVWRVGPL